MVEIQFPGGLVVKNLPANAETYEMRVLSQGWKDPPEKEMATHSSTLVLRIPWTEEPSGLQSVGSQKSRTRLSIRRMDIFSWLISSFRFFRKM